MNEINENAGGYGMKRIARRVWRGGERKRTEGGDSWRRRRSSGDETGRSEGCLLRRKEQEERRSYSDKSGSRSLETSRHHSECKSSSIRGA